MSPLHDPPTQPQRCSIRYPEPCELPAAYGSWCYVHYPYRCGHWVDDDTGTCERLADECVPYSTCDTDLDRFYCSEHYAQLPEDAK